MMTPERAKYYAKKYLTERIAYWGAQLEEIDRGVFYRGKEKGMCYLIYMDYKNEIADLDADLGNLTEEGHW